YVDPAPPAGAFPDGFTSERFFFQSYDAPLDRTEYLVVVPHGMKLDIDRRGEAPAPTRRTDESRALDLYEWAGRYRNQVFAEPATTPFSEYVPSVRVASAVSFAAWRDHLRDEQFGVQRSNDQLRKLALQLTQ